MRRLFPVILSLFFLPAFGQIKLAPIQSYPTENIRIDNTEIDTTLTLPFWEDFSITRDSLNPVLWKYGSNVNINNTFAINAPSAYVASLDGVDEFGSAYNQNSNFNGPGDSLVSQAINLSVVPTSRRQTVFLSFYYQLKGLGEIPDDVDSLQLQFLKSDSTWQVIDINPDNPNRYAITGGENNLVFNEDSVLAFQQVIVPVNSNAFFHTNFRIKFVSYSSLSGIYDTWNLDYIYLNRDRNINDLEHRDRSVSSSPTALFYPFHTIPAYQFQTNPTKWDIPQKTTLTNLQSGIYTIEFNHIIRDTRSGNSIESGPKNDDGDVGFRSIEFDREVQGISPSGLSIEDDSTVLETMFYYSTGDTLLYEVTDINGDPIYTNVDLKSNDTIKTYTTVSNFYAFDDGSAEFAAGINLLGGELAVKYWVESPDTLTAISIYFPNINPSSEGETIDIIIWSQLNQNGLQRRQPYTISSQGRNQFSTIELSTPLIVRDTFYIGYQQFTDNYIGLGFDKNNKGGSDFIYSNTSREWIQNTRLEGSMMIRPVFESNSDYILSIKPPDKTEEITLYPNPNQGLLKILGNYNKLEIIDISGQIVMSVDQYQSEIDLHHLQKGIYFVRIQNDNFLTQKKLILE